jgi:16S rRNA (guanine527-N7)-methyltransferase
MAPLDRDGFAAAMAGLSVDVSRETLDRLEHYAALLAKWQRSINLVAASTLADVWRRHFLDSAQLVPLVPADTPALADLGTGAGFPGLVIACLRPELRVRLVEADARKAAFLGEAARGLGLDQVTVTIGRMERTAPQPCPVVTARALAPLEQLCVWAKPWCSDAAICLFHKGKHHFAELTEARLRWTIDCDVIPSLTDPDGVILRIIRLERNK